MRAVIEGGGLATARRLKGKGKVAIGGKTGTATIILDKKPKNAYLASFAAFMPYVKVDPNREIPKESMPKYMVLVMVDENPYGKDNIFGGDIAPMAQDISDYMFCRENKEHPKCQSGQPQTIQQARPAAQRSRGQTSRRR